MQTEFYKSYINKYRSSLGFLKDRRNIHHYLKKLDEEKIQKVARLKDLMKDITVLKKRQLELTQIEGDIKSKSQVLDQSAREIDEHTKRCNDKQTRIMHWAKVINRFKKDFAEEFKTSEKRYHELNTLEIMHLSRQRVMLYELGSLLLNDTIANYIYVGILELHKDFREQRKERENRSGNKNIALFEINLSPTNKETEISTGLGYLALLLNTLSKYLNVPLKFPMHFCGSQSIIMRRSNENCPLYITKVFDKNKFNATLRNLLQNFMQIFEYFEVDITERKPNFRKLMETLIRILYGHY